MIILTGGAGFIGSCVLAALNARGQRDVLIVDSLRTGEKWKNIAHHSFLDIVSKEQFRRDLQSKTWGSIEAVIHMGACSATTATDNDYLFDNNYRYSVDVARFALERNARFIYASSAATYGDGERGFDDAERDLRPLNMYGYSKHRFDLWVRDQGLEGACVGFKFFNVFGPNEYHKAEQASMVWKSYKQVVSTGVVRLFASTSPQFSDGEQQRDFVYVKDAVNVVLRCLDQPSVHGILNVGSGVASSWNQLVKAVFAAMGKEPAIEYVAMPEHLRNQYQNYTCANITRLREAVGAPTTTLETAIADYVQGYLATSWPYL